MQVSRSRPRPPWLRKRRTDTRQEGPASAASKPAPSYSTQIIPFEVVAWIVRLLARLFCIPSFAVGVVGNIGLFGGSVVALYQAPGTYIHTNVLIFVVSGLCQLVIQLCQIYTAKMYGRSSPTYRFFVALSVLPSGWTYGMALVPLAGSALLWGNVWLIRIPIYILTPIALLIVLWLNDIIQEVILVKEPVRR